jgi:hypothetical protein
MHELDIGAQDVHLGLGVSLELIFSIQLSPLPTPSGIG